MTPVTDPLAGLDPARLPGLDLAGALAEGLAAFALGLLCTGLVLLARRALVPAPASPRRRLRTDVAAAAALPTPDRLVALARILAEVAARNGIEGPGWPAALGRRARVAWLATGDGAGLVEELCRPRPGIDPEAMERAALQVVARLGGQT